MKIAAYTIGNIDRASSRLRSFYLFSLAEKFHLIISRPKRFRDAWGVDVVHIQKLLSYKLIFAVFIYRILGIKVVFDIDDQPSGFKSFLGYLLILFLSSIITVDTDVRKSYWMRFLFFKKILVINDVADSNDVDLKIIKRENFMFSSGFFWIGYACNLGSLDGFIAFLKNSIEYKLIVSIEEDAITPLQSRYPFIEFIPWFDGISCSNDIDAKFMILNHNFDQASIFKSENKMVLAILAGFIPIVSNTPAYKKLAQSLEANFLLFDNIEDVSKIAGNLAEMDYQSFFERSLIVINDNYSRNAVLSKFVEDVLGIVPSSISS